MERGMKLHRSLDDLFQVGLSRRQLMQQAGRLGLSVPAGAVLLAAGTGARAAAAQQSAALSIGLTYDVTTLDATMQYDAQTINVYGNIYDTLLRKDWVNGQFSIQPHLAESITTINDTTWELKLRSGVTFHNGDEFTGEDVRFTVQRVLDPSVASPQFSNISGYDHVEVVDPQTIRIITKQPFPLVPITLCNLRIVPAKYFEQNGAEHVATNPVGTGPYKFVEWAKGDHVTLEANPDYWNGAPSIKSVVFRIIPEDATRIAALQTGNADLILAVPPINSPDLEATPDLTVAKTLIERISWIELQALSDSGRPTAKPEVRQAIAYAIDRDALIKGLLLGNGEKVATMLTPKHLGYSPDVPGYEFDLDKAKSLLAEAGYPDGVELDFMVGTGGQSKENAEAIAGQLSKAGITANINLVESAVLLAGWQKHDFGDMILATWTSNTFDADGTLYPLFHSDTVWSNYNNPEMDRLLDEARSTLDSAAREPLYKQALQILHDDMAGVPLWEQMAIYGLSKRLQWQPRPDQELFLVDASLSG
jgi:peptide/nickel transport system substrate-binding protein